MACGEADSVIAVRVGGDVGEGGVGACLEEDSVIAVRVGGDVGEGVSGA